MLSFSGRFAQRYRKIRKCWVLTYLLSVNLFFKEIIMRTLKTLKIVAAIAMTLGFATAQAAITSGSAAALGTGGMVAASVVVPASCTSFSTSGTLAFAAYTSGQAANIDASPLTLTANCNVGTVYAIHVGAGGNLGLGPWGGYRALKAVNSANYLSYGVYYGATANNVFWGDGVNASLGATYGGTGNGAAQTYTLNARLYGGQTAVADNYGDAALAATITF
jgi:spore coat protein U-like protein